jgi:hypothetical protein
MRSLKLFLFLLLLSINCIAQDDNTTDEENTGISQNVFKGFHAGFFAGAFFANNHSASLYDGYGVDTGGTRNSFLNSVLVQRLESYGMDSVNCPRVHSQYQGTDQIAQALGVSHDQWKFDESDMPSALKYHIAFLFGLDLQYGITKTEGFILNVNFAKLTVEGTFTITTTNNLVNPSLGDSVLFFGVSGQEQRLMIQLGYSRIFGEPSSFNVLVEGGLLMNSARFLKNEASINNLKIDLTPFTLNSGYTNNYLPTEYNAIGYGAFAGIGFNLNLNPKYLIQVIYSPSYEKINTSAEPTANLQQSAGLRVYYNF